MTVEATYVGPTGRKSPGLGNLEPGKTYEVTPATLGSPLWATDEKTLDKLLKEDLERLAGELDPTGYDELALSATKADLIKLISPHMSARLKPAPTPTGKADAGGDTQEK